MYIWPSALVFIRSEVSRLLVIIFGSRALRTLFPRNSDPPLSSLF